EQHRDVGPDDPGPARRPLRIGPHEPLAAHPEIEAVTVDLLHLRQLERQAAHVVGVSHRSTSQIGQPACEQARRNDRQQTTAGTSNRPAVYWSARWPSPVIRWCADAAFGYLHMQARQATGMLPTRYDPPVRAALGHNAATAFKGLA